MNKKLEIDDYDEDNYELPVDDADEEEEEEAEHEEDYESTGQVDLRVQTGTDQDLSNRKYQQMGNFQNSAGFSDNGHQQMLSTGTKSDGFKNLQPLNSQMMRQSYDRNKNQGASQMNVHQHFNQPGVVNYTQNAFYASPYSQPLQLHQEVHPTQQTLPSMQRNKDGSSPQTASANRRRPISAIQQLNSKRGTSEDPREKNFLAYNLTSKKSQFNINDFMNQNYRKKLIPQNMMYKKEDLYDQNLIIKIQMNDTKEENLKLRTRVQMLQNQLKGKDKLVDDLYKSTFITAAGNTAKSNLNKDVLMLIKLKRQVYELKDVIYQKDAENCDLKQTLKSTKIKELEFEVKAYMQECVRLRGVTENAVRMSGEIDLEKIKRQAGEMQADLQRRESEMQSHLKEMQNESKKIKNSYAQSQQDLKQSQQQQSEQQREIERLIEEVRQVREQAARHLKEKQQEIQREQQNVKEREGVCQQQESVIEELKRKGKEQAKLIPKRPEHEYIEDIENKNTKIEELLDELLKKDTLIDQQAVLNKNIQKKCDGVSGELKQMTTSEAETRRQLQDEQEKSQSLESRIALLDKQMKEMERGHKQEMEKRELAYDAQVKALEEKMEQAEEEKGKMEEALMQVENNKYKVDLVSREDAAVVEGFERLKRLCQVKECLHDQIENVLFKSYKPELKISIKDLEAIVEKKLRYSDSDKNFTFCRYLVEPQDEDKVEISKERTVAACKIIVRMMNQVGSIRLFKENSIEKMLKAVGETLCTEDAQAKLKSAFKATDQGAVGFEEFSRIVGVVSPSLSEEDIECAYVFLLRASSQLQGFKVSKLENLWKEAESKREKAVEEIQEKEEEDYAFDHDEEDVQGDQHFLSSQFETDANPRSSMEDGFIREADPKSALKSALDSNLLTGEKSVHSKESIKAILQKAEVILTDLAQSLSNDHLSMRALLNDCVFTMKHPSTNEEIEIVTIGDLSKCLQRYNPKIFQEEQEKIVKFVFTNRMLQDKILFEDLSKVMKSFGIREDIPRSKKHLNYDQLDLKSKRILNRLFHYLSSHSLDLMYFFRDELIVQTVKTKTKTEKVDLIRADALFKKMKAIKVTKSDKIHENLCKFLCIDETYVQSLMVKKLKRAQVDLSQSAYFSFIGFKKRKLKDRKEDDQSDAIQTSMHTNQNLLIDQDQERKMQGSAAVVTDDFGTEPVETTEHKEVSKPKQEEQNLLQPDEQSEYEYDEEEEEEAEGSGDDLEAEAAEVSKHSNLFQMKNEAAPREVVKSAEFDPISPFPSNSKAEEKAEQKKEEGKEEYSYYEESEGRKNKEEDDDEDYEF